MSARGKNETAWPAGPTDREIEMACCEIDTWVGSVRSLAEVATRELLEMNLEGCDPNTVKAQGAVTALQDGIAALSEKSLAKLEWVGSQLAIRTNPARADAAE